MTSHATQELIPLYALDALPEPERDAVDAHLDSCMVCLGQLGQYLLVTATLVPDQPAPRHVWGAITASIAGEAERRRFTSEAEGRIRGRDRPGRLGVWAGSIGVAAAAAAAMLLAVGSTDRVLSEEMLLAAAEVAVSQPGSYVGEFVVDESSVARVILTGSGQGFFIPDDRLPVLDLSKTYQLWVVTTDDAVISGGVVGNAPEPSAFTWDGPVSGFALTREVAGGVSVSAGDVVALASEN